MPNLNQVVIQGHLGGQPEIRYSKSGKAFAKFSVATNHKIRGEEHTEWHRVTAFGSTAEGIANAEKGAAIHVHGRLQTDKWQDQSGQTKYSTGILADVAYLLPWERKDRGGQARQEQAPRKDFDDRIPF